MGRVKLNHATQGFSGKFGDDIVFRQIKEIIADASIYASLMLEDPQQSEWYSTMAKVNEIRSAQLAAVKDYMSKPEIKHVDLKAIMTTLVM